MRRSFTLRPYLSLTPAALLLVSCEGVFSGLYDEPVTTERTTVSGQLYIDASDWKKWHYIDLEALADSIGKNPAFNTSSAWVTMDIPTTEATGTKAGEETPGVYTYWYDVYGSGLSNHEFRDFTPTGPQPEPEKWSLAVHRNNLRTNGGAIAATTCTDIDKLPWTRDFMESLDFREDEWNVTDVWMNQDRMLLGLIGNQGIRVNKTGSEWLRIDIPPMPPAFTLNQTVFIIRLADGTHGAIQLADYQDAAGTKCCLTINYRYPLPIM